MNAKNQLALFSFIVLFLCSLSSAEIPRLISYQGKVTESGQPVSDGSYTMRVRIYNDATSGSLRWDSGNQTVQVTDGIFTILLGESGQPTLNLSFDEDLWILVTFEGDDQSPRQRLASAGYAYMASGIVPGTEVIGAVTSGSGAALIVENTATSICHGIIGETNGSFGIGVKGISENSGGTGVYGAASATSGETYGIYGRSVSSEGYGVYGEATATYGSSYGVYGISNSTSGHGVCGEATTLSGTTVGVIGTSNSTSGRGVYGGTTATSGITTGVYGASLSTSGRGVAGYAGASSGVTYGVYGESHSGYGRGVYGLANDLSGESYGVYGESNSISGRGVYGGTTASFGETYGVYGQSASSEGYGVYGEVTASSGMTSGVIGKSSSPYGLGVYGDATSTSGGDTYGVYGACRSTSGSGVMGWAASTWGEVYGVWGQTNSNAGRGVYGEAMNSSGETYGIYGFSRSGSGYGVYGEVNPTSAADAIGVYGECEPGDYYGFGVIAKGQYQAIRARCSTDGSNGGMYYGGYMWGDVSGSTGTVYGVYGRAEGGSSHYGVYYSGGINGSGIMRNTVRTEDGPVSLYTHQSTENWFEDFGSGIVRSGRARIALREDYRKTITSNEAHPMKVFVTPTAQLGEWWVDKDSRGFTLIAPEASDGASFDYRIVGKRKDAEDLRLEPTPSGYADTSLYPDEASVPAEYLRERRKSERVQESDFE